MKYNEQNVIGLIVSTTKNEKDLNSTYNVVEGALIRQSNNERISYNHITTAGQLNNGYWTIIKSKIYELW